MSYTDLSIYRQKSVLFKDGFFILTRCVKSIFKDKLLILYQGIAFFPPKERSSLLGCHNRESFSVKAYGDRSSVYWHGTAYPSKSSKRGLNIEASVSDRRWIYAEIISSKKIYRACSSRITERFFIFPTIHRIVIAPMPYPIAFVNHLNAPFKNLIVRSFFIYSLYAVNQR